MKTCIKCNETKELQFFYKKKANNDGYNNICISCILEYNRSLNRTEEGLINQLYYHQKSSSKKRKHDLPEYSKQEFRNWIYKQSNFKTLFDKWVKSEYDKNYRPSIDRTDINLGYTFDNIVLTTWEENFKNYINGVKSGRDNRINKKVYQYDLGYNLIKEYYSINEASRQNNLKVSSISACANGFTKTSGDYIWSFVILEKKYYSREEVYSIMQQYLDDYVFSKYKYITPQEWIEENL